MAAGDPNLSRATTAAQFRVTTLLLAVYLSSGRRQLTGFVKHAAALQRCPERAARPVASWGAKLGSALRGTFARPNVMP